MCLRSEHNNIFHLLVKTTGDKQHEQKIAHLPLARVKNIMKLDQDMTVVSLEAVFLTTKATELFIQSLVREAFVHTQQSDKRTLHRKDIDAAIQSVDSLCFLEETLVNNS